MSDSSSSPEWEDDDELIDLNELDEDMPAEALSEFQRAMFENKVIHTFVRNAFDFGGANTLIEVFNQVERKMGWRTEIIADKNALDDYMFYRYETFDEEIWNFYVNSDEYQELTYRIAYLSTEAMLSFADKYARRRTMKEAVRARVRKLLWKVFISI
jgi:hypothetical protein